MTQSVGRDTGSVTAPRHRAPSRRRRARRRWLSGLSIAVVCASGLGAGLGREARAQVNEVTRLGELDGVLTPLDPAGAVENTLIVGSDTRAGADPSDADYGSIGDEVSTTGRRSDTLMVLRYDRNDGTTSMLSLPRDLWVDIDGERGEDRINAAYSEGAPTLVRTVQRSLGLPVHHYLEVDFQGFKAIVDAIGGVTMCFMAPARDGHTGLVVDEPGCHQLDGVRSLQYARSRYFEQLIDGEWRVDGTADLGRIGRQQDFVRVAMRAALEAVGANPFRLGRLTTAATDALSVDPDLDLVLLARRLRPAAGAGITSYPLPVSPRTIDGKAILVMEPEAALPVLAFFQGGGPAPV